MFFHGKMLVRVHIHHMYRKSTSLSIPWASSSSDSLVGDVVYGGFLIQAIVRFSSFFWSPSSLPGVESFPIAEVVRRWSTPRPMTIVGRILIQVVIVASYMEEKLKGKGINGWHLMRFGILRQLSMRHEMDEDIKCQLLKKIKKKHWGIYFWNSTSRW